MNDFTFLTEDLYFSNKIDVIAKRGIKAAITDFSILLGGYVSSDFYINKGSSLKDRAGIYWTKNDDRDNDARVISRDGSSYSSNVYRRKEGARPALSFSSIDTIPTNGVSGRAQDNILEVEYGYYPQTAVSKEMQRALETAYNLGNIQTTGNTYTTDSRKYNDYDNGFLPQTHIEYEYDGKMYVRVKANSYYDGKDFTLSNGETYKDGNYVWVEVEPVRWLVDERAKVMITEKIIFAGIQFNKIRNYKTSDFYKTDIKKFMDQHLSKDLFQTRTLSKELDPLAEQTKEQIRKKNPYEFDFRNVSEEDIIKGAVQSGVAVFLHGRSSEGKSARVKQLDPEAEIIYLRNATPDSLNGKSVYNQATGEMFDVKPTWLKSLKENVRRKKTKYI